MNANSRSHIRHFLTAWRRWTTRFPRLKIHATRIATALLGLAVVATTLFETSNTLRALFKRMRQPEDPE